MSVGPIIKIGVVTTSDRAAAGIYPDEGTPEVVVVLRELLLTPFEALTRLVPDERALIEQRLIDLVDAEGCCLV